MPDAAAVSGMVLIGMPGSGKSTVGRLLAERLGRPFIDTDLRFAERHRIGVPDFLRQHGEPAFRAAEAKIVTEACHTVGAVISAGGGAVLDPLNRWALWHHGTVAWLDLPVGDMVRRLAADAQPRPTFEPYDARQLAAVLAARAPCYRAADLWLDAGRPPSTIVDELVSAGPPPASRRLYDAEVERHHPIGPPTARVVAGVDLDPSAATGPGVAVVDRRLPAALTERLPARARLSLAGGERAKRMGRLQGILEWLAAQRAERGEPLLAVGGGTIGDLAGTAAALFARGLPLVQLPTTWLAQADSAIGGKVAVNLGVAKNMVGAFWPPVAVVSDVGALRTLPVRRRREGMAESVKSALIGDPALWSLLESRGRAALRDDEAARYAIVEGSARLKLAVCGRDPFESGERRTLNLGHTVGHALEAASGYRLAHGPAVAIGMRAAAAIAAGRGADAEIPGRLDELLAALGFRLRHRFDPAAVRSALLADKKRLAGRQRWILPLRIGQVVEADDVQDAELEHALREIAA